MLIVGGGKAENIERTPLLKWYHDQFREFLLRPDTRLMVIGYSFNDPHINSVIEEAADAGGLSVFIIDPRGADVLDKRPQGPGVIRGPATTLMNKIRPRLIDESTRRLISTFSSDKVEHSKVMGFFK
jgi:hypothetical protein